MASTGETWRLGHRPALDGLRGVAVLLVLLQHAHTPHAAGGGVVGVTMFFTLSGFLITALLLQERDATGRISLAEFYRRRALRLIPAMWVCVAAVTLVAASAGIVGSDLFPAWQWLAALTYTSDLTAMHNPVGMLNATWSLAVEEKFYLLWPLVLVAVQRRRALAVIAVGGMCASTFLRFAGWNDGAGHTIVQYGPHTHAGSLLAGCLLAILLSARSATRARPWLGVALIAAAALGSVVAADYARHVLLPTVVPVLVAAGIWALACGQTVTGGPLTWAPLVYFGRRSYGFYLWQWPVSLLLHAVYGWEQDWVLHLALLVPIAWGLTVVSWRFVESPFLAMKARSTSGTDQVREPELGGQRPVGGLGVADGDVVATPSGVADHR